MANMISSSHTAYNVLMYYKHVKKSLITFFHLYFYSCPRDAVDNLFQHTLDVLIGITMG